MIKNATNPTDPFQKAHMTRNIKMLLMEHFVFRAYIRFHDRKTVHLYGNEHKCTYNQLLAGRFPSIVLDREKGYTDLIGLLEGPYRNRYQYATIYMRTPGTSEFDIICRQYDRNGLKDINDPVLPDDQKKIELTYTIQNGRVLVASFNEEMPDFKTIIQQKLNDK